MPAERWPEKTEEMTAGSKAEKRKIIGVMEYLRHWRIALSPRGRLSNQNAVEARMRKTPDGGRPISFKKHLLSETKSRQKKKEMGSSSS